MDGDKTLESMNFEVDASMVDGGGMHRGFDYGCKEVVESFYGEDIRPPIRGITIRSRLDDGRIVCIWLPNNPKSSAKAILED